MVMKIGAAITNALCLASETGAPVIPVVPVGARVYVEFIWPFGFGLRTRKNHCHIARAARFGPEAAEITYLQQF